MKKLLSNNKIKYLTIICLATIGIGSVFGIAALFINNKQNNKNNIDDTIDYDEFMKINIHDQIKQQNLNNLLDKTNLNIFSENQIKNNIYKISKNAINNSKDFESENIEDYQLKIHYKLNEESNDLKINIFMYNKIIKNKKFKTSYRIYII